MNFAHNNESEFYISDLECNWEVEIQKVKSYGDINTIFTRKCRQLIIFRKKGLDVRPKSVCTVEMTRYVQWTFINRNIKDDHP